MRQPLSPVLVLCASIIFTSLPARAENPDTLKVGAVLGLTGPAELWSAYQRMAIELARDEINERAGVKGKKVEVLFEDSKSTPVSAVAAYTKLVEGDEARWFSRAT